jgi:uncharacterized protein YijF (DUF1287 family)
MPRQRSTFYDTIEYIGPRPQKPKRQNFFGGWVIFVIAAGIACWFGKPLVPFLRAAQVTPSPEAANLLIPELQKSSKFGDQLAAAALAHSRSQVSYDPAYYKIPYPNGDVPVTKGVAADVLIRCYRMLGIDLQEEIHEDMTAHFREYPQLWNASEPDSNIDHRRVPNLDRFFSRYGQALNTDRDTSVYAPGDIVVWALDNGQPHIGIVVPGPASHSDEPWVVHNHQAGVKWENVLFDHKVISHYRYPAATGD